MARNPSLTKRTGPVLVTGAAGFIGYSVCDALLQRGERVIGFDALTPYNDPALKKKRLSFLQAHKNFSFVKGDLSKSDTFLSLVKKEKPRAIIHLAAQAGVRYSQENPQSYIDSNITGSLAVFEAARLFGTPIVYASSSSVYGDRGGVFRETDRTDSQSSLYAATKKSTEIIAENYYNLYRIPLVGLRFFTVYGPWMRTDLAMFSFARKLLLGKEIPLFANGKGKRSYTHISFVVEGVLRALDRMKGGHTIYNLGEERTVETNRMLALLSKEFGVAAKTKLLPPQKGDVMMTRASGAKAKRELGVSSKMQLEQGVKEFAMWFRENEKFLLSLKDMHS